MSPTSDNLPLADEALGRMRDALAEGRLEDAVALGREALGAAPRYPRAISGLVAALKRAGHAAEARRVLDQVPTDLAGPPADLVAIAEFCLSEGVEGTAKEMLRTALETDPTRAETAELLARLLFGDGDVVGVVAVCEPFRVRGRAPAALLRMLAAAYEQLGDLNMAAEVARIYARIAPLDPHAHYHLATLEHRAGELREATERYRYAIELSAADGELAVAAAEGMRALDALQLRQITALAASDPAFRVALGRDLRAALEARGFSLSDDGLSVLAGIDLDMFARHAAGRQGYGYH